MTKAEFIAAVEAKSKFIRWATEPVLDSTEGDVELWHGRAYHTTTDGTNVFNVWFHVDKTTGDATWQTFDSFEPEANTNAIKQKALTDYLSANFDAYFVVQADLENNWAEADVYKLNTGKLDKFKVLVFKKGGNPISHLDVNTI